MSIRSLYCFAFFSIVAACPLGVVVANAPPELEACRTTELIAQKNAVPR